MTFDPGASPFRLRIALDNAGDIGSGEFELYAKKNSGSYVPVTATSTDGIKSYDASSDADDTIIRVPRLYPFSPGWQLSGAAIDFDFAGNRIYPGGAFSDYLSCSRASIGYVTNGDGTLTQIASDVLRVGVGTGLLVEAARTNVVLWCCDLTNAAWTPTNITPLKDQTGPDGVSNSASSILATAGNATILQSITLGSSDRAQSAYVKRLVGSGTISMTMDNGSTWTAISVTDNWTQVSIPTQMLANPTVGFKITTNADKIAVAFVNNENGVFSTSPILTTTTSATRAEDSITFVSTLDSLFSARPMSAVLDLKSNGRPDSNTAWNGTRILYPTPSTAQVMATDDEGRGDGYSGFLWDSLAKAGLNDTIGKWSNGAKIGIAQDTTDASAVGCGGTVITGASPGTMPSCKLMVFPGGGGFDGYCRRLTAWNSKLADATLQSLTS